MVLHCFQVWRSDFFPVAEIFVAQNRKIQFLNCFVIKTVKNFFEEFSKFSVGRLMRDCQLLH